MPIPRRRVTVFRRRRSPQGAVNVPPRLRRRALLTGGQAKEILYHWDRQITRLRQRVDELEEQNARLVAALKDAVEICDAAMAPGRAPLSSHVARLFDLLSSQSLSLRSQVRLRWRPLLFSAALLSLTFRRKLKPSVGWPFEPVRDEGESPMGSMAAAPRVAQNTGSRSSSMGHEGAERPPHCEEPSQAAQVSPLRANVGDPIQTEGP
jgi:hypothetical protein